MPAVNVGRLTNLSGRVSNSEIALSGVPASIAVDVPTAGAVVANTGTGSVDYALVTTANLVASPSSGTLAFGASQAITLTGNLLSTQVLSATNTSGGRSLGNPISIIVGDPASASLTLSGPADATATVASSNFQVVAADIIAPITIVPTNVAGVATFSPASVVASPGDLTKLFTATWATAGADKQLRAVWGSVSSNTLSVNVAPAPAATTATLSGGTSSGTTNSPMTVTVTLNGPVPSGGYTATLGRSGVAGSLAASSLVFTFGGVTSLSTTNTNTADGASSVTLTGAGLTPSGSPQSYTSSAATSTGTPQPFTLTSSASGSLPFAIGYPMSQGHVPSGQSLTFSGATAKMAVLSTWPDGSARLGIIAGTYTSAGSAVIVTPTVGTASIGTPLTGASVQAAMASNTAVFDAGAFGSATFSGADFASPFMTHFATDAAGEFIYRKQIGSDAHLVAWIAVRLWASGAVEVLPWVENGYLNVASPINKSATFSFTLGGTSRFSAAIDLPNHCRTPLVLGSPLSHWLGTDPAVTPTHNKAYLQATRLVPTYFAVVSPSDSTVTALPSTYTPLQLGSYASSMGTPGYHGSIGVLPEWDALFLASTASTTWSALQRNAYSAGRYGVHFRDESTNRPIRFSSYPTLVVAQNGNGISGVGTSSTSNYTPTATGTSPASFSSTHHPSMGCMAYLLTGRFFHLETTQFLATLNYLKNGNTERQNSSGIFLSEAGANTPRGAAWAWRTLAQAASITPDADPLAAEFNNSLAANITYYHTRYVAQANNPMGFVSGYTDYTPAVVATTEAGSTSTSIVLPAGYVFLTDGYYIGWEIVIGGQTRVISAYVGATRTATVTAFGVTTASQSFELRSDNVFYDATWMQDFFTAAVGYSLAMLANIGTTATTKLRELFDWKAQSVVGRLGTEGIGEYLYRDAAVYTAAIAPTNFPDTITGTGPWYAGWGQVYTDTFAIAGSPGARTPGDLRGGNFPDATSYWGNMMPALAYAVEHGVAGASAGRSRLTSASNWSSFVTSANSNAVWAVAPAIDPLAAPAWRTALSPWQWTELTTATLSAVRPASLPGASGAFTGRVDAWNGMAVMGSKVTMAGVGGHADYAGNEGYSCDLAAASPVWTQLSTPTIDASIQSDVTHYADGNPTSSHTYYSLHANQRRNKLFRMGIGSAFGSGNFQRQNVDAFSLTTNTWDAANTWPQVPEGIVYGKAQCQDPITGNVYVCGNTRLMRFNQAAGTWTNLATFPNNGSATYYHGSVFDTARNRVVIFGDAYRPTTGILIYDVATNTFSTADLTGALTAAVVSENGDTAHYNAKLDKYLYFTGGATVIEIDPTTWATSTRSTTGGGSMVDSINGVFQKLVYVPSMRGYAYQVRGSTNLWFLASE